jgi:uncharacterized iron-regulated membrane protein
MTVRNLLFWLHLVAGIISGLAIGIMCFTGTVLAFEKELVVWSERDARQVEIPAGVALRLSLDELQQKLRAAHPDVRPMSIVLQNDPRAAVAFPTGRTGGFYVNPYSGEVRQPKSAAMGRFMQVMVEWHRYLGFHGEVSRPRGKWINGTCNIAFCVLAVTGLYLWMPRSWTWRALRPVMWFRQSTSAKARDFNWHNTIGFWTEPVLIVLTLTAMPISFRWAGNLIFTLTGTPAPATTAGGPGGGAAATPSPEVPAARPGARPLTLDALVMAAQKHMPEWKTITIRTSTGGGSDGRSGPTGRGEGSARPDRAGPATDGNQSPPPPVTLTVRERAAWPRTATTTLTLNPFTGDILRRAGYAEMNAAQQVRSWTRFLHTGEALGPVGQFIAGLACLGGLFLVYTGLALSWRRFFGRQKRNDNPPAAQSHVDEPQPATAGRAE